MSRSGRRRRVRHTLLVVCSALGAGCSSAGPKPPDVPQTIVIVSGDSQRGTVTNALPSPLVVRVLDAGGRGVSGVTVAFQVTMGSGTAVPAQTTTDANGSARTQWLMGTSTLGGPALEARVDAVPLGDSSLTATFHATALPGPAIALAFVDEPAAAAISGQPFFRQPTLVVVDQYENAVPRAGVMVSVALVNHGLETLSGTIDMFTDARGVAEFTDLAITGPPAELELVFTAPTLASITSSQIDLLAPSAALSAYSGQTRLGP